MHAKLRFNYGTMSSGKSLRVLTTAYDFESRKIPFIILKSVIDVRDGMDTIKSRIGDGICRGCIPIKTDDNVYEIVKQYITDNETIRWILVDECQFFSVEQIDQLSDIVDYLDIDVTCFGLRTDFKTNTFPGSQRLFEIADKVEEMKSMCSCGRKNIVNARVDKDGNILLDGEQNAVGGDDMYKTMCRKCYKDLIHKRENCSETLSITSDIRCELLKILHSLQTNDKERIRMLVTPLISHYKRLNKETTNTIDSDNVISALLDEYKLKTLDLTLDEIIQIIYKTN